MDDDDLLGAFESFGSGSTSFVPVERTVDKILLLDAIRQDDARRQAARQEEARRQAARQEEARRQAASLLNDILQRDCCDSVESGVKRFKQNGMVPRKIRETVDRRVTVRTIQTDNENCTHEVALRFGMPLEPLVTRDVAPAKSYPFQLDAFQREAITCVENNQSILVSAHTSAGKTVVALYAIAQSLRDKRRVIYISPIKALSYQKFRELEEEFGDVGDVTLNAEASCIVMTTEILRSMLYKSSEVMKRVAWVIFDEIHYMRDKERGVVWEESIILLPHNVHHVFLSATIPNAPQFARWVCWLHKQPVHVVCTNYPPTPVQHFIFPVGGEGLYEGQFLEDKFTEAMSALEALGDKAEGGIQRDLKADSDVVMIIRTIKERSMLPCIIFSFSRRECEAYALSLMHMYFNDDEEKKLVRETYNSAVSFLNDDDKKIPQIRQILPLLLRGIGVHHSGLIPFLKETVELLFGEGLLKTLFTTETFSMGLNMPARTVLFTWISSGEYVQMSGRAGRRGKDDRGLVILMVDQKMSSENAKQIIKIANLRKTIKKTIHMPKYLVPFLHVGRVLHIVVGSRDFGWAVFVNFHKKIDIDDSTQMVYILETSFDVVSLTLDCVDEISSVRLKLPPRLDSDHSKSVVQQMVKSLQSRFLNDIHLLDPIKDMHISEPSFIDAVEKATELEERSKEHPLRKMANFNDIKAQWLSKDQAKQEHRTLCEELQKAQSLMKREELGRRKRLLRRLEYIDQFGLITDKVCRTMFYQYSCILFQNSMLLAVTTLLQLKCY
uniref:Helicase ATP-binding domain-containing protein n=1 Tax=Angiostrongylus cantonensis TaxID=6313 RepID=A0A0K0D1P2_ANGCA